MAAPGPAALGGAGAGAAAPAPEAGAVHTRSRGKAFTVAQSRQAALGIAAAAPPTLAESMVTLSRLFSEANPSQELHVLNEFTNPLYAIQPAVVPNFDIESVKESLDKIMDENLRALIQLPTEKDDSAEVETATEEEEEEKHIAVSIPVGSSNYLLNPNLLANVKDSYSADVSAGDVPIYFFIITNFGHASIIIYSMGVLYSVGLGLNYGSWAARSATPRLEGAFTGREDFLADGVLLSPDFLVKPAAINPKKGTPFNYKIIDIGLFKTKHAERILSLTSKSTTTTAHFDKIDEPHIYQFSHFEIDIKKKYMYLSSAHIAKITGDFYNCVSFAQIIFRERVDCTIGLVGPVDPFRCRSRLGDVATVRGLFEEYMRDYISGENLSRTFPRLDFAVAGGGRRRRSRRNKMRRRSKVSRRYRK
jgi:hypothetical protein